MRNKAGFGYATLIDPDHPLVERDTFQCAHCQYIMHIKPMTRPEDMGGHCKVCDGLICPKCVDLGECDPFEEKLKRYEAIGNAIIAGQNPWRG